PQTYPLFPYTTLFRSRWAARPGRRGARARRRRRRSTSSCRSRWSSPARRVRPRRRSRGAPGGGQVGQVRLAARRDPVADGEAERETQALELPHVELERVALPPDHRGEVGRAPPGVGRGQLERPPAPGADRRRAV